MLLFSLMLYKPEPKCLDMSTVLRGLQRKWVSVNEIVCHYYTLRCYAAYKSMFWLVSLVNNNQKREGHHKDILEMIKHPF